VQQEHQAGALPKLVLDRASSTDLVAVSNKTRGEIGAIHGERSRHNGHPFARILFVSIRSPHRLP
jgi:hypothetical protein